MIGFSLKIKVAAVLLVVIGARHQRIACGVRSILALAAFRY
jgi:hypothetical protein